MRKQEFLNALEKKLSHLPRQEAEERLTFYSEMIDDRVEEGKTEEEAVAQIGSVDEIAAQIRSEESDISRTKGSGGSKRRIRAWEILLLALGSPIWFSLAVAALAVLFSVLVVIWSVAVSLWAVFASVAACAPCGIIVGTFFTLGESTLSGIALIGVGCVCAGLAILLFFGCKAATKGMVLLTVQIAVWIKNCFVRKENAS